MRDLLARLDPKRVAQLSGLVFIGAGLVKFVFYHWELHAFRDFGIPVASVMEPIVGVLEILGGALLLKRMLILPAAFVLAVIMLVAFITGGLIHASPIPSDTLAPALLVSMVYLGCAELRIHGWPPRLRPDRPVSGRHRGQSAA
ncbi:MAG TPA: DoxX family protein [Solirubrobacteraceae bacterium]|nr:DoxX family protein [Solirubrobacteraceae bacterium]